MKRKSIIREASILIAGSLLSFLGWYVVHFFEMKDIKKDKIERVFTLLQVARNQVDFYYGVYLNNHESTNNMIMLAKNKNTLEYNGSLFAITVYPKLLEECCLELINYNINDTLIRYVTGCHYDLINFNNDNILRLKNIEKLENVDKQKLMVLYETRNELLKNNITNCNQAIYYISKEIKKLKK